MKNLIIIIRILLSLALLGVVYTETGWATALFVFLVMLKIEIEATQYE